MSDVWKVISGALVTVLLGLSLRPQRKDMSMLLSIAASCMVIIVGLAYLRPIIDFIKTLSEIVGTESELFAILIKSVGIGLIGEIACLICSDSGNAALGKAIQILTSAVVLWLAIPLMKALLDLVQNLLGEL